MRELLSLTISGLVTGGAYAGAACGLVLVYKATRVFNLAHGAIGMFMAFLYWQLCVGWGLSVWLVLPLLLLVAAPGFGMLVEQVMVRGLPSTPVRTRLVVTAGLGVGLIGLAQAFWAPQVRTVPPILDGAGVRVAGVLVSYHSVIALAIVSCVATGMYLMLSRTPLGASMRASVHDPGLLALYGASPRRPPMVAWALGSMVAALPGVLLAPVLGLDYYALTLVVLNAFAAAVFGRLTSMRLTFVGAMLLGLLQVYAAGYLPAGWSGLRAAIPALMLLALLPALPGARPRLGASRGVAPASGFPVSAIPVPDLRRSVQAGAAVVGAAWLVAYALDGSTVLLVAQAFCYGLVMLSLVLLTGYGGHVSLAQLSFVGIGAAVTARLATPSLYAVLIAGLVAAAVGALVALPAARLTGLYLALGTLAFAQVMDTLVFGAPFLFGDAGSLSAPPLSVLGFSLSSPRWYLALLSVVFVAATLGLLALRRGRLGRLVIAVRDDPAACASLGLSLRWLRVALLAASAGLAGIAGGLLVGLRETVVVTDFQLLASLPVLLIAVVCGVTSMSGALAGGFALVLLPLLQSAFPQLGGVVLLVVGFAAVILGRNPDGLAAVALRIGRWVRDGSRAPEPVLVQEGMGR
jgi:branched-chain amino acid transport system permease protein